MIKVLKSLFNIFFKQKVQTSQNNKLTKIDPILQKAASELTEAFQHTGTIFGSAVIDGKKLIYAYLPNKLALKDIPDKFNGFEVIKKVAGNFKPL